MVVLFNAGVQFPVIPLLEDVGNAANTAPLHIGDTAVKVGVTIGFTVIVIEVVLAHCPTVGVNV
ncbi:MAG: hypothetical protein COX70_04060 [Flavobacteriales bacterium CG_4_10_14_0_2_um_filter_32_8]|nr:MAG: hypothetical protein COX70_04060 [Flavobacteriales bacterium CG_4_10_14_0_2_um_filter_32_8]